jgi:hypothetical protein
MNLAEKPHFNADCLVSSVHRRSLASRISKPFLSKFITRRAGVPGAYQLKYYAPHVGNVRVGWRGEQEEERETLKLVDLQRLGPVALAKVHKAALELDLRARERSKVYRQTAPLLPL